MPSDTGILAVGDYDAAATAEDALLILKGIIPNPDSTSTSGAQGGGGMLDQMSPAAAVQLRVEIDAMIEAIGDFDAPA